MKKIALLVLAALFVTSCNSDREHVLKVYNWSCYIDETVIPEFEQWYKEQTGEDIKVIYQTFDINETMLSKIEKGHEDFDVVCPSDYIIERMLNSDMLLPLDFSLLSDDINYIENNRSPYVKELFSKINPNIDANNYSVAYMWGTVGLLYNAKYVSDDEAFSWKILSDPKFAGKIFIKDAPRDVYSPILMYLNRDRLEKGEVTMDELMLDSSDESIAAVEEYMKKVKELVAGWEADFGKEQMTKERGYISLNWSGDAVWAIEEAAEIGVDLRYQIPAEGTNVWFDGWVIPKYARNRKAATYFIDFMCRPDIAIRNMEVTGYVSANGNIEVLESQVDESYDPIDISYFFGEDASAVCVNPALYPDRSTIVNCALMHDWGDDSGKLLSMWARIKGNNANSTTIIVVAVSLLLILSYAVYRRLGAKRRHTRSGRKSKR